MDAMLRALDARDLEAAMSLFAPHATLTTAFGETASDLEQVRAVLGKFLVELRATHHNVIEEWNPEPGVWIAEMSATYELTDFSERGPYQRVIILRANDDGIEQMRMYGSHELPLPQDGRQYREVQGPHGWLATL
jgi:SnoaL-like domain